MTEVRPWLDQEVPEELRRMLKAARMQQPSSDAVQRVASLVALMHSTDALGAGAEPAASSVAQGFAGAKWSLLGGGLAGIVATVLGVLAVQSPKLSAPRGPGDNQTVALALAEARQVVAPDVVAPAVSQISDLPIVDEARSSNGIRTNAGRTSRPKTASVAAASPQVNRAPQASREPAHSGEPVKATPWITHQTIESSGADSQGSFIDRARNALKRGQAPLVLQVLDQYDRAFARRQFEPEAMQLRMRAHMALGDSTAARRAAEYLVKHHPGTAQGKEALEFLDR